MRACENFGRTSAPFLPQCIQVKLGSMSESRTVSVGFDVMAAAVIADQHVADAGFAHLAEGDLLLIGRHDRRRHPSQSRNRCKPEASLDVRQTVGGKAASSNVFLAASER